MSTGNTALDAEIAASWRLAADRPGGIAGVGLKPAQTAPMPRVIILPPDLPEGYVMQNGVPVRV